MRDFNLLILNENPDGQTTHFSNNFHCKDIHTALKIILETNITNGVTNPNLKITHIEISDITDELRGN